MIRTEITATDSTGKVWRLYVACDPCNTDHRGLPMVSHQWREEKS